MHTRVFIEIPEDSGKMIVGYQLSYGNYIFSPKGIVRIARFECNFSPKNNLGYYGDIYMKKFVKKWKNSIYKKKVEKILDKIICIDLYKKITEFL